MGRKEFSVDELVEALHQWHMGRSISQIKHSVGIDRKTIVFDNSYYSMPTRFVSKKVWCRGGFDTVQVFYDEELVKTHQRSYRAGTFKTDEGDYPPEKSKYLLRTLSFYQEEAAKHGEHVCQLVTKIMEEHAYRNLRKVQGIFRLAGKYGNEAIDLTSRRSFRLAFPRTDHIRKAYPPSRSWLLPLSYIKRWLKWIK